MKKIILLFSCLLVLCTLKAQDNSYQLSTHILDINKGEPAKDVEISLYKLDDVSKEWKKVVTGRTDMNGRIANLLPQTQNNEGQYKLHFETRPYFDKQNIKSIYPYIEVIFEITGNTHFHIPITLSANGYSTYRGN